MTIKEKQKRDIKIFEMKLGIAGEEEHTYEELARKFNLSRNQVLRNVKRIGIELTGLLSVAGFPSPDKSYSVLGKNYSFEDQEKIYTTFIAAYQHGQSTEG